MLKILEAPGPPGNLKIEKNVFIHFLRLTASLIFQAPLFLL